jgi:hypothetical protein
MQSPTWVMNSYRILIMHAILYHVLFHLLRRENGAVYNLFHDRKLYVLRFIFILFVPPLSVCLFFMSEKGVDWRPGFGIRTGSGDQGEQGSEQTDPDIRFLRSRQDDPRVFVPGLL